MLPGPSGLFFKTLFYFILFSMYIKSFLFSFLDVWILFFLFSILLFFLYCTCNSKFLLCEMNKVCLIFCLCFGCVRDKGQGCPLALPRQCLEDIFPSPPLLMGSWFGRCAYWSNSLLLFLLIIHRVKRRVSGLFGLSGLITRILYTVGHWRRRAMKVHGVAA